MKLETIDIHELLPQREPFIMVDRLTFFDEQRTSTRFVVRADNLFVEDGVMDACALAENMAQTCAVRLGYVNKYILKRGIQVGFIGAVKNMIVTACPRVGDVLETTIEVIEQVMDLTLVKATVRSGSQTLAMAEMKIALANEIEEA